MVEHGFIRDMLDVKCLILFVMKKAEYPLTLQKIYELCFQDDKLSYFDLSIAVPQMVESGHLEQVSGDRYRITPFGMNAEEDTSDSIAYPVMMRAKTAVEEYNVRCRQEQLVKTAVHAQENGEYAVEMELCDHIGKLLKIEVMAPNVRRANQFEETFRGKADGIYRAVMAELLKQ